MISPKKRISNAQKRCFQFAAKFWIKVQKLFFVDLITSPSKGETMNTENFLEQKMHDLQDYLEKKKPSGVAQIIKDRPDLIVICSSHARIRELLYHYGIHCKPIEICFTTLFEEFNEGDWARYLLLTKTKRLESFLELFNSVQLRSIKTRMHLISDAYDKLSGSKKAKLEFDKFQYRPYDKSEYARRKYQQDKDKFINEFGSPETGFLHYLKVKKFQNRVQIHRDNVYAYEYIVRRNKSFLSSLGFGDIDMSYIGPQKNINISLREICEMFINKINQEEITNLNLRKIDYAHGLFLSRYGHYWKAITYIRAELGYLKEFNEEVRLWIPERYEEFMRELQIDPLSNEGLKFIELYENAVFGAFDSSFMAPPGNSTTLSEVTHEY